MSRIALVVVAFLLGPWSSSALAAGYRFIIPTVAAQPGTSVRVTIQGEHEQSAQGFTCAARYPSAEVTIDRIHIEDTILEALNGQEGVDYFEKKISPSAGTFAVGVLVDTKPPFEGNLIPNIGRPLDFLHLEVTISATASGALKIKFENGLFNPPLENLYSVDNAAIDVTELGEGIIQLPGGQGAGAFIRGDFNMSGNLDISDPIGILGHTFFGQGHPTCLLAGDATDDDTIDISDPIRILYYLFLHGPPPPDPFDAMGSDPTPGELGCDQSLEP